MRGYVSSINCAGARHQYLTVLTYNSESDIGTESSNTDLLMSDSDDKARPPGEALLTDLDFECNSLPVGVSNKLIAVAQRVRDLRAVVSQYDTGESNGLCRQQWDSLIEARLRKAESINSESIQVTPRNALLISQRRHFH